MLAPNLHSSITFQQVGSSTQLNPPPQMISPKQEPSILNQQFLQDQILSQFQIQTQDLFKKTMETNQNRPNQLQQMNSMQKASEQDFISDSQQKGIGSQYSEHMYTSGMISRPPDARYPPEMQLIEPHEVIQSRKATNMTIRSNMNHNTGPATAKQSAMQIFPGASDRSSSQFHIGNHQFAASQPRNMTPNLQTASLLKSPDLIDGHNNQQQQQQRPNKSGRQRDSSGGLLIQGHETGIQQQYPQHFQHKIMEGARNANGGGPSTMIFVNETSLINKDLDMVEAAANLVKQRSIEVPYSRMASRASTQSHATKTLNDHSTRAAAVQALENQKHMAKKYQRGAKKNSFQRQMQTGQTDEISKESQTTNKISKRPSELQLMQGVAPQRVSVKIGGANLDMERTESLLTNRKGSHEFHRIETLEPNQLPHLLKVESYDRDKGVRQAHKKNSCEQIKDWKTNCNNRQKVRKALDHTPLEQSAIVKDTYKRAVLTSQIATSQTNVSNKMLDMLAKQATPRKSQILSQHSHQSQSQSQSCSRSRSPTTTLQNNRTPQQNARMSPSTAKRGLSQAGEDLDRIIIDGKKDDLESKKSRTNHRVFVSSGPQMAKNSNMKCQYQTQDESRCCSSLSNRHDHHECNVDEVSRMMHRFGSIRLSEAKVAELEETDQASQPAQEGQKTDDYPISLDKVKSRILRNFDNFKVLLSLDQRDVNEKKLLQRVTEDTFLGMPECNISSEQRCQILGQSESGRTGSSSVNFHAGTGITNLAVALEKFKKAFKEKRIGSKSSERTEIATQKLNQDRDRTAQGSRVRCNRPGPDMAFQGVQRVLSHQRSAHTWNARRTLHRKGHSISTKRPRTNQIVIRPRQVAVNLEQSKNNPGSQDYFGDDRDTNRIQSLSPVEMTLSASRQTITKHMLNQRTNQNQTITLQNNTETQSAMDIFQNDTLIIKSIKQTGNDPAVFVPTAQTAAASREKANTRLKIGSRRVSRFGWHEKRGSTEIGTNTIGIATSEDFIPGKESSLLVGDDMKFSVGALDPHQNMLLPACSHSKMSPTLSKATITPDVPTQNQKAERTSRQNSIARQLQVSTNSFVTSMTNRPLETVEAYENKRASALNAISVTDSPAPTPTPGLDYQASPTEQAHFSVKRIVAGQFQGRIRNVRQSFIKVRDEQPRSSSPLIGNMLAPKAALQKNSNSQITKQQQRRAQNKSIQFNRLPSYMQKKYFELFRPKELQEMVTTKGKQKQSLNSDIEKQALMVVDRSDPGFSYGSNFAVDSKRDFSPSMVRVKHASKFRQRRIILGKPKEKSNLTNLLKNVNFFKAEKQLLHSKSGLKYSTVAAGGQASGKMLCETFDAQPIEPLTWSGGSGEHPSHLQALSTFKKMGAHTLHR